MSKRFCIGVAFILALSFAGCKDVSLPKGKTTEAGGAKTGGGVVSAVELCKEYKAGESTADGNYKNKELTVEGTIDTTRPPKGLTLKGEEKTSVLCNFSSEDTGKLKKGDTIKVQGTCTGRQGSADAFSVGLKDCKLVK